MAAILSEWIGRVRQDLEPTPGPHERCSSYCAGLCHHAAASHDAAHAVRFDWDVLRVPRRTRLACCFVSIGHLLAACAGGVGCCSADSCHPHGQRSHGPCARCRLVSFIAGMFMLGSNLPALASTWGFIFCVLIAAWETSVPASALVKTTLYILGTISLAVASVRRRGVHLWHAGIPPRNFSSSVLCVTGLLKTMFTLYAKGADAAEISPAVSPCFASCGRRTVRHAAPLQHDCRAQSGHGRPSYRGASSHHNARAVDGYLGRLWMAVSRLVRSCLPATVRPHRRALPLPGGRRYPARSAAGLAEHPIGPDPSLLDRAEGVLHAIISMPVESGSPGDKQLVALPSSKVPLLVPGALRQPQTIAFALKLSLCATLATSSIRPSRGPVSRPPSRPCSLPGSAPAGQSSRD